MTKAQGLHLDDAGAPRCATTAARSGSGELMTSGGASMSHPAAPSAGQAVGLRSGLEIDSVRIDYPGLPRAVDAVSLSLAPGEIVALLGPSGCGKSSLLRGVAGLETLAEGRILADGIDVTTVPVHQRGFGLMFQDGQLFPFRDVAGNVGYGLRPLRSLMFLRGRLAASRLSRRERSERVTEMLALVGLEGYEKRDISTLSGGQAQRVALARSLAPRPRLLLLDEPLSALDRAMREQLSVDIRYILKDLGMTALYVTHDHAEAEVVADRIGVMSQGMLVALGTMEELQTHGSDVVARFLGA